MPTETLNKGRSGTQPWRNKSPDVWKPVGHFDPGFKASIISELDRLASLQNNWDQYGATQINSAIIEAAKKFVLSLPDDIAYRPLTVPMSSGNLQFEWHHRTKVLELEFESANTIRFLQWDPDASLAEEDTFRTSEIDRAVDLIQWFMSGTSL